MANKPYQAHTKSASAFVRVAIAVEMIVGAQASLVASRLWILLKALPWSDRKGWRGSVRQLVAAYREHIGTKIRSERLTKAIAELEQLGVIHVLRREAADGTDALYSIRLELETARPRAQTRGTVGHIPPRPQIRGTLSPPPAPESGASPPPNQGHKCPQIRGTLNRTERQTKAAVAKPLSVSCSESYDAGARVNKEAKMEAPPSGSSLGSSAGGGTGSEGRIQAPGTRERIEQLAAAPGEPLPTEAPSAETRPRARASWRTPASEVLAAMRRGHAPVRAEVTERPRSLGAVLGARQPAKPDTSDPAEKQAPNIAKPPRESELLFARYLSAPPDVRGFQVDLWQRQYGATCDPELAELLRRIAAHEANGGFGSEQ